MSRFVNIQWVNEFISIGWDEKIVSLGPNCIKCNILLDSIQYRYVIGKLEIHMSYRYIRFMKNGETWSKMDCWNDDIMIVQVIVLLGDTIIHECLVEKSCML